MGMVVADAVRGCRRRMRWSWGWESSPSLSRCYGGGSRRWTTLGMGWSSWTALVLGVVRRRWRWGSSSSDDAGTEGGGGGHRHQDAVGVVDVVTVEMLWGVIIVGRRWRWDGRPGRRWRWGSLLSNNAGGWGSLLLLSNDTEGWGWSSLSSHDTGDEGRRCG